MKLTKIKTKLLSIVMFFVLFGITPVNAQVTIGSDEFPIPGSLLQLKDTAGITGGDVNATKGVALPRVKLSDRTKLFPMFLNKDGVSTGDYSSQPDIDTKNAEHTGLVVYNLYESEDGVTDPDSIFTKGLYVWSGDRWENAGAGGGDDSGCGGIIPFASGGPVALVSANLLNGALNYAPGAPTVDIGQAIGFGSAASLSAGVLGDAISLDLDDVTGNVLNANLSILNNAFIMPTDGAITDIYASFTATAALELSTQGLVDNTLIGSIPLVGDVLDGVLNLLLGEVERPSLEGLSVVLYGETDYESDTFKAMDTLNLNGSEEDLASVELGTTYREKATSINIPVKAGCRYFLALQSEIGGGTSGGDDGRGARYSIYNSVIFL